METRIKRNIIIVVVLTFLGIIGMCAGWFFVLVRPQREQIASVDIEYQKFKATAETLDTAQKDRQKAEDNLQYLKGQIQLFRGSDSDPSPAAAGIYRRLYFGAYDSTDAKIKDVERDKMWRAWMNEYHSSEANPNSGFGWALQTELQKAADDSKVKLVMPAITVDDPPQTPEAAESKVPANGFLKPLSATNGGSLSLQVTAASVQDILRFLENLNHSNILMVVDKNLKLEGYSPTLKATFNVTPYLVIGGPGSKLASSAAPAPEGAGAVPGGAKPGGGEAEEGDGEAAAKKDDNKKSDDKQDIVKIKNPRMQAGVATP